MRYDHNLVVIGAGSAGLVAAMVACAASMASATSLLSRAAPMPVALGNPNKLVARSIVLTPIQLAAPVLVQVAQ